MLVNLVSTLEAFVVKWNAKVSSAKSSVPPLSSSFVRAGVESKQQSVRDAPSHRKLLDGARDWKLVADFGGAMVFPAEIVATAERPDIVMWSPSSRRVLLLELTCPAEEGIDAANLRKNARYEALRLAIVEAGWFVEVRPIEVGARGFVARSVPRLLRDLGFSSRELSTLCRTLATVVARCSYTIYLASSSSEWRVPDLLRL